MNGRVETRSKAKVVFISFVIATTSPLDYCMIFYACFLKVNEQWPIRGHGFARWLNTIEW